MRWDILNSIKYIIWVEKEGVFSSFEKWYVRMYYTNNFGLTKEKNLALVFDYRKDDEILKKILDESSFQIHFEKVLR